MIENTDRAGAGAGAVIWSPRPAGAIDTIETGDLGRLACGRPAGPRGWRRGTHLAAASRLGSVDGARSDRSS